ncbi:MAG: AAA domain-containing protein [Nitrososphaeria archaeon]|nr:AAA domain-containing protein [Nitrososphaeria archaeon]NIQ32399.1 AAA domain-containing protein [Nitrososphaeria archaeon]
METSSLSNEVKEIQSLYGIVGREDALKKALIAIRANKHLLIEGQVGVGKTILALVIAKYLKRHFYRLDGDERYTERKLTGWFDPPFVIKMGYVKDAFFPGPLTSTMEKGGILFINELNRMPEGVQNVLLPAMDEKQIEIPKIGKIRAKEGFIVIATQNPREFIGTTALSEALRDRFELLTLNYQTREEEVAIVEHNTAIGDGEIIELAVDVARATRSHPDIKRGASVRAAMSMALIMMQKSSVYEAACLALPTRIEINENAKKKVDAIINEVVRKCLSKRGNIKGNPGSKLHLPINIVSAKSSNTMADVSTYEIIDKLNRYINLSGVPPEEVGWVIAQNYPSVKIKCKDAILLRFMKRIAILAIINRTLRLLGPTKTPTEIKRKPHLFSDDDEIDLEDTLEQILEKRHWGSEDVIVESKEPRKMACALMIDASLSMSGEKLAIATASIAVLAYKMKTICFSLIIFNNYAKVMKSIVQKITVESLISDLLDIYAMGLTNIEDALRVGSEELEKVMVKDKFGIIITDGNYTAGKDPREVAERYPKLFVIMLESRDSSSVLCEEMATIGNGKLFKVSSFDEIPRIIYKVLRM